MGYQLKSYNDICKIVQLFMNNVLSNGLDSNYDGIFFVDYKKYTKTELKKKKNIIGYTTDWLAIISVLKDSINKGFKNKLPYIQEIKKNALDKLKLEPLYIYYTTDVNSFMPEITKSSQIYKFVSTRPITNFTTILLDNPYDKLVKMNIKIINYK